MTDQKPGKGILYVATGERYVSELLESSKLVKLHMPDIPIAVVTDQQLDIEHISQLIQLEQPEYNFFDKIRGICATPFDHTLFLDTDVYVVADVSDMFNLLTRVDLALGIEPWRRNPPPQDVPPSFPELNLGVMAYRNTPEFQVFASEWKRQYEIDLAAGIRIEQPAFRKALYESDLRFSVLPPEYHCRPGKYGALHGEVKIIHGHHLDVGLADALNREARYPRVFQFGEKLKPWHIRRRVYHTRFKTIFIWSRRGKSRLELKLNEIVAKVRTMVAKRT